MMKDYIVDYKKIAVEKARLLKHLTECAEKRAALLQMEMEEIRQLEDNQSKQ